MRFDEENKINIIKGYNGTIDVTAYINKCGVSKGTFYKWARKYGNPFIKWRKKETSLVEITDTIKKIDNEDLLYLYVNNVGIKVNQNYNEELLLRIVSSLKKK